MKLPKNIPATPFDKAYGQWLRAGGCAFGNDTIAARILRAQGLLK